MNRGNCNSCTYIVSFYQGIPRYFFTKAPYRGLEPISSTIWCDRYEGGVRHPDEPPAAAVLRAIGEYGFSLDRFFNAEILETVEVDCSNENGWPKKRHVSICETAVFVGFIDKVEKCGKDEGEWGYGWYTYEEALESLNTKEQVKIIKHIHEKFVQRKPEAPLLPIYYDYEEDEFIDFKVIQ